EGVLSLVFTGLASGHPYLGVGRSNGGDARCRTPPTRFRNSFAQWRKLRRYRPPFYRFVGNSRFVAKPPPRQWVNIDRSATLGVEVDQDTVLRDLPLREQFIQQLRREAHDHVVDEQSLRGERHRYRARWPVVVGDGSVQEFGEKLGDTRQARRVVPTLPPIRVQRLPENAVRRSLLIPQI